MPRHKRSNGWRRWSNITWNHRNSRSMKFQGSGEILITRSWLNSIWWIWGCRRGSGTCRHWKNPRNKDRYDLYLSDDDIHLQWTLGSQHFVLLREVVLFRRLSCPLWEACPLLECPLSDICHAGFSFSTWMNFSLRRCPCTHLILHANSYSMQN